MSKCLNNNFLSSPLRDLFSCWLIVTALVYLTDWPPFFTLTLLSAVVPNLLILDYYYYRCWCLLDLPLTHWVSNFGPLVWSRALPTSPVVDLRHLLRRRECGTAFSLSMRRRELAQIRSSKSRESWSTKTQNVNGRPDPSTNRQFFHLRGRSWKRRPKCLRWWTPVLQWG